MDTEAVAYLGTLYHHLLEGNE